MDYYEAWRNELVDNFEDTCAMRRYLHENPELSFQEERTAAYILSKLQEFGIDDLRTNVGNGFGLVATIHGAYEGPTIALRADFDALPIHEESSYVYHSKNPGIMHACGHDAHTASLLSVAKVMQKHVGKLHGKVVFLFQNAEEVLPGGAKSMIKDGCLDGVDAVYGIHISSQDLAKRVLVKKGFMSANSDIMKISVKGKGGHAAYPELSVDALMVAVQIASELQQIVSRKVSPIRPAVLTIATLHAGGDAYNVIAETAEMRASIRSYDAETRALIKNEMIHVSKSVAQAHHADVSFEYLEGYPATNNSVTETERIKQLFLDKFGNDEVEELAAASMGGEDFAYYLKHVPGSFIRVGAGHEDPTLNYPLHHAKVTIDEGVMLRSGEVYLAILEDYLV